MSMNHDHSEKAISPAPLPAFLVMVAKVSFNQHLRQRSPIALHNETLDFIAVRFSCDELINSIGLSGLRDSG